MIAAAAAVVGAGMYIRWAARPARAAFRHGKAVAEQDAYYDRTVLIRTLAYTTRKLEEAGALHPAVQDVTLPGDAEAGV
jgi:hypothetical protein